MECHADDTPRFIAPDSSKSTAKTGVGQNRQCQDWTRSNDRAENHGACCPFDEFLRRELEGKKICPEAVHECEKGSEYLTRIWGYLNQGSKRVADGPEWPEINLIQE